MNATTLSTNSTLLRSTNTRTARCGDRCRCWCHSVCHSAKCQRCDASSTGVARDTQRARPNSAPSAQYNDGWEWRRGWDEARLTDYDGEPSISGSGTVRHACPFCRQSPSTPGYRKTLQRTDHEDGSCIYGCNTCLSYFISGGSTYVEARQTRQECINSTHDMTVFIAKNERQLHSDERVALRLFRDTARMRGHADYLPMSLGYIAEALDPDYKNLPRNERDRLRARAQYARDGLVEQGIIVLGTQGQAAHGGIKNANTYSWNSPSAASPSVTFLQVVRGNPLPRKKKLTQEPYGAIVRPPQTAIGIRGMTLPLSQCGSQRPVPFEDDQRYEALLFGGAEPTTEHERHLLAFWRGRPSSGCVVPAGTKRSAPNEAQGTVATTDCLSQLLRTRGATFSRLPAVSSVDASSRHVASVTTTRQEDPCDGYVMSAEEKRAAELFAPIKARAPVYGPLAL